MGDKRAEKGRNAVIFAVTSLTSFLLGFWQSYARTKRCARLAERLRQALIEAEARNEDLMKLAQENTRDDQTE